MHGAVVTNGSGVDISTGYLTVGGLIKANGGIEIVGTSVLDFVTVHNNGIINGDFNVIGATNLSCEVEMGSNLKVKGLVSLDGGATSVTRLTTDRSLYVATTEYTQNALNALETKLVNGAPAALDTLKEISDILASDESAAAALLTSVSLKAPLASPTFTGTVSIMNDLNIQGDIQVTTLHASDIVTLDSCLLYTSDAADE